MTPQVTIITPTYNKPTYFAECAQSVLTQKFDRWIWWVIFNKWTWEDDYKFPKDLRILPIWYPVNGINRKVAHITARIVNWIYPKVQTPYIYFLADDDLIDPEGLSSLVYEMEEMWMGDAVYGRCDVYNEQPDGTFKFAAWAGEGYDIGLGCQTQPDCFIDSSQILHTKELWDKATADGWQLTDSPDPETCGHADGILLNRLAEFATFKYVPQRIVSHRRTKLSSWHKPQLV